MCLWTLVGQDLDSPSYIVERLSPRTEHSGIEPLKPMIHFLDPEPTYWSWISPPPTGVGVLWRLIIRYDAWDLASLRIGA